MSPESFSTPCPPCRTLAAFWFSAIVTTSIQSVNTSQYIDECWMQRTFLQMSHHLGSICHLVLQMSLHLTALPFHLNSSSSKCQPPFLLGSGIESIYNSKLSENHDLSSLFWSITKVFQENLLLKYAKYHHWGDCIWSTIIIYVERKYKPADRKCM
jgi:hypothetical protein